ncbi:4873_t:CDS:2 [Racocetra fulgida]|uniref:4873_t:CDS:1 n=1 Tax=Racocetra fulgida TaxID=60492 RepID=A0A9N8ZG03_9GLOM|nr:4873_t:CDS:2 [Racocetra fulgida]
MVKDDAVRQRQAPVGSGRGPRSGNLKSSSRGRGGGGGSGRGKSTKKRQ